MFTVCIWFDVGRLSVYTEHHILDHISAEPKINTELNIFHLYLYCVCVCSLSLSQMTVICSRLHLIIPSINERNSFEYTNRFLFFSRDKWKWNLTRYYWAHQSNEQFDASHLNTNISGSCTVYWQRQQWPHTTIFRRKKCQQRSCY